jgi:predicted metal-dependent hydrolase
MHPKRATVATSKQAITLDGVEIELVRKRIKNIYVRVLPPLGRVCISAPLRMSEAAVREFALSKLVWIRVHQERMRAKAPQVGRVFAEGEECALWGLPKRIRFFPVGGLRRIFVRGDFIDLHARESDSPELRARLFEKLLFRELERELVRLLALWSPVIGAPMPEFSIRRMRTRWGSCSPAARRVRFALHLAEKPVRFLEYVVVHELVHLLERSHNERFTALMDGFLPHWRTVRREMRALA